MLKDPVEIKKMTYWSFYDFYLETDKCHEGSIPGAVFALCPTDGKESVVEFVNLSR